jgi:hypothetical protein
MKGGVVESFYTLRAISVPETTDSLYVGTPVTKFTHPHHTHKLYTCIQ